MITHVVLFQMKEPKHENTVAIADALRSMEGRVAGLGSITVGVDVLCFRTCGAIAASSPLRSGTRA